MIDLNTCPSCGSECYRTLQPLADTAIRCEHKDTGNCDYVVGGNSWEEVEAYHNAHGKKCRWDMKRMPTSCHKAAMTQEWRLMGRHCPGCGGEIEELQELKGTQ